VGSGAVSGAAAGGLIATGAVHRPGIVVALRDEARCLGCALVAEDGVVECADGSRIGLSGMGAARAAAMAQRLLAGGADSLLSWGTCGALSVALNPGDLLLPEMVLDVAGARYAVDASWRSALLARLPAAVGGTLLSVPQALAAPAAKTAARARWMADAVDMESAAVAAVAARAGVPFVALRAVVDGASRRLPAAALAAVDSIGRPRLLALLGGLARSPAELPALLALGRDFSVAQRTLRDSAARLADHWTDQDAVAAAAGSGERR